MPLKINIKNEKKLNKIFLKPKKSYFLLKNRFFIVFFNDFYYFLINFYFILNLNLFFINIISPICKQNKNLFCYILLILFPLNVSVIS